MTDTTLQRPRERIIVEIKNRTSYFNNVDTLMETDKRHSINEEVLICQSSLEKAVYLCLPVNEQSDTLTEDYSNLAGKGRGIF